MPPSTLKLSLTHRGRLLAKYGAAGVAAIEQAVSKWQAKDAERGFRNLYLAVDDGAALKPFGVAPLKGAVTAAKVKVVVDRLCAKLAPDYLVLLGAQDVLPQFEVANPTLHEDGDTDAKVPTDNPYACSRPFVASKRASFLIPDRVVGRMPDLPGADDPAALLAQLATASGWKSKKASSYAGDLLACCDEWVDAGRECVKAIGRAPGRLQVSPPATATGKAIRDRHRKLLHMIKVHGAELDAQFYGQAGDSYPELLTSPSLTGRTRPGTVVGAMCCFGASFFDPSDPAAVVPGALPIPAVYLQQGAFGFAGSTTTAWVGVGEMMCADWIVTGFLKSFLGGASLGRAFLEAKQDFVNWIQKQGRSPDLAEEKTLLQFVLLGDPSVHPVAPSLSGAGAAPAGGVVAAAGVAVPAGLKSLARIAGSGASGERAARRAYRVDLGAALRGALPERRRVPATAKLLMEAPLAAAKLVAERLAGTSGKKAAAGVPGGAGAAAPALEPVAELRFDLAKPLVQRVAAAPRAVETSARRASAARAVVAAAARAPEPREVLEYYWSARRRVGPVTEVRMLQVVADEEGNVLRSRMVVSS